MIRTITRTLLPRDRTEVLVVFLIALVGGAFYHPGQWNQNARLAATAAFVEPGTPYTGTFRIDGLLNTARFRTGDWARWEGRLYSNKAPGVTFLGVVPYFLLYHGERLAGLAPEDRTLTNTNAFLLNLCISVFWNIVAALALLRALPRLGLHSPRGATFVAAMYAFATLVLPYGSSVWGHATTAAFVTLGTLALFEASLRGSTLAGWWFGLALLTEYFAALSLGLAGALLLLDARPGRLRHVVRFVLGSALPVGVLMIYQKVCFGGFLTTASGASNPAMLDPAKFAGQFGVPDWTNLVHLYFSSYRGLLPHMPILVLSGVGLVWWYRTGRRGFAAFAIANIVLYSLAVSAMTTTWHGGVTTSSRYLIVALPFFCLLLPDLDRVPLRGAFVVLFAITTANMFVVAATSTMLGGSSPIYNVAYSQFWRGEVAFNPLLAGAGVHGLPPALVVALMFAAGLTLLVRTGLPVPVTGAREAVVTRLSKSVVLASLVGTVAWIAWQTGSSPIAMLTGAAAIGGIAFGESLPLPGVAVILLLAYWVPAPYNILWTAALAGLLLRDHEQSSWSYPPRWRPALILWALTIAVGWPLIALRELDFEWPGLLSRYAVTNTATGSTPAAVIATIANAAAVHLLGLLWLDWLFRRFASSSHAEVQRWIVWPLAISAIAGCAFAILQSGTAEFAVIAAVWSAGLLALAVGTRRRVVAIAGSILCWSVVLMSGSRTALLAAGVALAVAAIVRWRGFPVRLRAAGAGTAAGVAVPAASIASHPFAGLGIGMSAAPDWWRQSLGQLGILGAAGIIASAASLVTLVLRGRADAQTRVPAAAVCGALSGMAVVSMSTATGHGLLMAITAGTFAFWIVRLVDSEPAASGGLRPLAWIGVGGVLAAFVVATVIAARGELRVPRRAAQGGWPYAYGIYRAPASAADGAFLTERHGVAVVTIEGPSMILTIRADHPDIRERPVTAQVDVDGRAVIRTRLYTNDPLVRKIDAGGNRRAVVETRVDRTWHDTAAAGDPRAIGLSLSWRFSDN